MNNQHHVMKKGIPVPSELWRHKNMFETYLMMGPSRTLRALSEMTGTPVSTLKVWNKNFGWEARLDKRDEKALAKLEESNDKAYLEEIKVKHQKAYQKVQEKALKAIDSKFVNFESDKDAAQALDIGIKGEREVLGLNSTKIKAGIVKEGFAAMVEMLVSGQ